MSNTVIKIENLSKIYRLGEVGTGTLSHDLNRWWKMNILRQDDPYARIGHVNDRTQKAEKGELIAALRDINLEVKQGEVLGIIGKNGAGKSTLLKLLSRVTSPTTGTIKTKGRLASLLEVGTGFHPEMTGRENIYMNGTIMGMRKWEITNKLDEIVDFAGVAKYLDTPTKRYSSGMTVRLGFAIAAFLEPEILIVDEVLAVGDAEFQKKAIGKMQDVSKGDGRTVLFVSHNMASIQALCSSCMVLENGQVKVPASQTEKAINQYLQGEKNKVSDGSFALRTDRQGDQQVQFLSYEISIDGNNKTLMFQSGKQANIKLKFNSKFDKTIGLDFAVSISKSSGELVTVLATKYLNQKVALDPGEGEMIFSIPKLQLMEGEFYTNIIVRSEQGIHDWIKEAFFFGVENGDFYKTGKIIEDTHKSILFDYEIR
jgi:lipopolysaccharide transport system ATP-binding protein